MLAFKFRCYPSKEQKALLWKDANKLNFIYNKFLEEEKENYEKGGTYLGRFKNQAKLPNLKKEDKDLKLIHSQVLQQVPKRLNQSFEDFFDKKTPDIGLPKFRACRNFFGIIYPQGGYKFEKSKFI